MKTNACIIAMMLCLLLTAGPHAVMSETDDVSPNAGDRVSPGGVVLGGLTELGMLALGITWEGVRIVLPKGCPLKERDIDGLVGAHRTPYEEDIIH